MGTTEDIQWLQEDKEGRGKVFHLIAGKGKATIRELKELYGSKDWWPVKTYVELLVERGLVVADDNFYNLTEQGKKVRDSDKVLGYVPELV